MIRIRLSGFLIFFFFSLMEMAATSYSQEADTVAPVTEEELYVKCKSAYADGEFVNASQYIDEFLSLYTESEYTAEMLFMQAFLHPDINSAIESYKSIIENYPDSIRIGKCHFQIAQNYYLQGEYDKALEHYGKIMVSHTEDEIYWPARYWRCKALIAKGSYEEAALALRSLESINPAELERDMTLLSLGNCYSAMGDYEKAADAYRSLIESMPESEKLSTAYLLLAKSYQNLNRLEDAKSHYQKVVEFYPKSMDAQQAQQALDSPLSPAPEGIQVEEKPAEIQPVETQPTVPEIVEKIELKPLVPARQAESYYSIQVGAFSRKRNADNLTDRLRKKGYSVRIVPPSPGGTLYKVRVGEFRTKGAELSKMVRKLRDEEKLPIDIVYQPAAQ